jgi:hypothetical protein
MYMVKRVFKNKHLLRNLFILAGLAIVGFFVWRAFFSGSKDGFQTKGKHSLDKLEIACTEETKNADTESKAVQDCITNKIEPLRKEAIEKCLKRNITASPLDVAKNFIDDSDPYQICLQEEHDKLYANT